MPDDLIERIKQLSEHWGGLPLSDELHEQITQVYHKKALNELLHCVKNVDGSKKNEDQQVSEFSEFLKTNWERINSTCMSYTAQPESDLTQLLCDIASFLGLQKRESAIHLLMPSVATESITDKYKNLTEFELKEVLRTYILGQEGSYLIPVKMLLDVAQCNYDGTLGGRYNPYYDYEKHAVSKGSINDEECSRLIKHSPATQALHDTTEYSIQIEKQQTDLLSQLNNLCRTLRFNDAHGGIGRQERAGEGAYLAIAQFQEFFGQLTQESRDKTPQTLLDEIKLLISVSSDPTLNRNAAGDIQTCIGTRREKISDAMKGHEAELESIRLDENSQQTLKKQAEAARDKARNELETRCDNKSYKGKDVLGVNLTFLQWLEIRFEVSSIADINILMRCSAHVIQEIINSNPRLLIRIAEQLNSMELLIGFIVTGHEHEKIKVVLGLVANNLNYTARDFSCLLLPLNPEQVELVCRALKDRFKVVIKNSRDFESVLQDLGPEQRAVVCNAFKDHFKDIIKNSTDFIRALHHLTPEQSAVVCNTLKDRLKVVIQNVDDFGRVLQRLAPEQGAVVCGSFKDHLRNIIKSGGVFRRALEHLAPEQRAVVCDSLKDHFKDIIKNSDDFRCVLEHLAPEQCAVVCDSLKDHFKDIIKNGGDFAYVLKHLAPEKRAVVYNSLKDHFKDIIKNDEDFNGVLEHLVPEQRAVVYRALKDHFKNIIKSGWGFRNVLEHLVPEQRVEVCNSFKDHFKDIIKNGWGFRNTLELLVPEQRAVVYGSFKDHFKDIIEDGMDFRAALEYLVPEHRAVVYSALKEHFKDIIKDGGDFGGALEYLVPEQRTVVYNSLKDYFKNIIKNSWDFRCALKYLVPEQRVEICNSFKDHFKNIIKNSGDFGLAQEYFVPEQRAVVCSVLKDHFKDIIKNSGDFGCVLYYLEPKECAAVCSALQDRFKDIIKDSRDFGNALRYLTSEQGVAVFSVLKDDIKAACLSQAAILDKEQGRKIQQFWFDSLLHDIPVSTEKQAIVNPLKEQLTQASKDFFEQNYTPEGYKTFKKTCQDAVNTARPQLRGWDDFFKKLALAIITIGLAPAILAVHSKVTKGSFNFSFFPEKEEQSIDKLLNSVGDKPRVK